MSDDTLDLTLEELVDVQSAKILAEGAIRRLDRPSVPVPVKLDWRDDWQSLHGYDRTAQGNLFLRSSA